MCKYVLYDQPENASAVLAGNILAVDHESGFLSPPSIWGFRTVVLVERRDDVFDRLASDLAATQVRIVRASCSIAARRRYLQTQASLLLVNADQPGESTWLLAAKLRLTHPAVRIWAYKCKSSRSDIVAARFLKVDELIEHLGDLSRLSREILHRFRAAKGSSFSTSGRAGQTPLMDAVA